MLAPAPGLERVSRVGRRDRASDRVYAEFVDAIRELRLTPGALISNMTSPPRWG